MKTTTVLTIAIPFFLADVALGLKLHDANLHLDAAREAVKQTQAKLETASARARAAELSLVHGAVEDALTALANDQQLLNYTNAEAFRDAAALLDTRHVNVDGVRLLNDQDEVVATNGAFDESDASFSSRRTLVVFDRKVGTIVASKKLPAP